MQDTERYEGIAHGHQQTWPDSIAGAWYLTCSSYNTADNTCPTILQLLVGTY